MTDRTGDRYGGRASFPAKIIRDVEESAYQADPPAAPAASGSSSLPITCRTAGVIVLTPVHASIAQEYQLPWTHQTLCYAA